MALHHNLTISLHTKGPVSIYAHGLLCALAGMHNSSSSALHNRRLVHLLLLMCATELQTKLVMQIQ